MCEKEEYEEDKREKEDTLLSEIDKGKSFEEKDTSISPVFARARQLGKQMHLYDTNMIITFK